MFLLVEKWKFFFFFKIFYPHIYFLQLKQVHQIEFSGMDTYEPHEKTDFLPLRNIFLVSIYIFFWLDQNVFWLIGTVIFTYFFAI